MKKRLLSILLCIGLLVSVLPMALAEGTECPSCGWKGGHLPNCELEGTDIQQSVSLSQNDLLSTQPQSDPTAYEQMMAALTVQEMYDIASYADLTGLTAAEIDGLFARIDFLDPEGIDPATEALVDLLITLPGFTSGAESDGETGETYTSGIGVDAASIFYANSTTAGYFTAPNNSTSAYNATTDAIVFTSTGGDPHHDFTIPTTAAAASSNYGTYKYIAVTFKAASSGYMQLFLKSSTSGGYAEARSRGLSYSGKSEYQTLIFDVSGVSDQSVLSGNISGFRFDYSDSQTLYLDSVAFCKTREDAEYIQWERDIVRNDPGKFVSAKDMLNMVSMTHNCSVEYVDLTQGDQTIGCLKITMNKTNCSCMNGHDAKWHVVGTQDSFDPQFELTIPGSITSDYDYLVLNFMAPSLDVVGVCDQNDDHFTDPVETIPIRIGTFYSVNGGYTAKFERNTRIDSAGVFYSEIVNIDDDLQTNAATIRFDPFAVHFAKAGSVLYLQAVMFCKTEEEAKNVGEEQLGKVYPYGYNLTFNANASGVSGMPNGEAIMRSAYEKHDFTVSYDVPTRANYKFLGWCENSSGTGKVYQPGEVLTIDGIYGDTVTTNLYAIWQEGQNQIRYDSDLPGAKLTTGEALQYSTTYGSDHTLTLPGAELTGYEFQHWSLFLGSGTNWNQTTYKAGTVMPVGTNGDVTLKAQFTPITYTATFNTDGGEPISSKTFTIEEKLTLPEPEKLGYDFQGWKITSAAGSWTANSIYYADKEFEGEYGNVTFTAQWEVHEYTIGYDLQGGTAPGAQNPTSYTVEDDAITLNNPERTYYEFDGWTGTDLTGKTMTVTIPKGSTGDRVYTANWKEVQVTLNYQTVAPDGATNFGTLSVTSETIDQVTGTPAGSTATASYGYRFVGWYSDEDCTDLIQTDAALMPSRTADNVWVDGTYYAKFDYARTDLVITVNCPDSKQSFIFTVKSVGETVTGEVVNLKVALVDGESVTIKGLPLGHYTVVSDAGWSWRYTAQTESVELKPTQIGRAGFTYGSPVNHAWLNEYERKLFKSL